MFRRVQVSILLLLPIVSLIGCGEPPTIRQYVIDSETEPQFTSELLRREFPAIPFRWQVPAAWTLAANDQFSVRAWNAGPPTEQARVTLGQFPARTGIPAQVMRWRRQLGLDAEDVDAAMKCVESLKTKNGAGSFATVEGASETILAFILPIRSQFWIFRFRGPNTTTKVEGDGFRAFCESLEYVSTEDAAAPTAPSAGSESTATKKEPSASAPSSAENASAVDEDKSPSEAPKESPDTEQPPADTDDPVTESSSTEDTASENATTETTASENTPTETPPSSGTSDASADGDATPEGDE